MEDDALVRDGYARLLQLWGGEARVHANADAVLAEATAFFREEHHFHAFADDLKARGVANPRIWCNAASTGEEPYSIAMTVQETLGASTGARILASDIDTKVLAGIINSSTGRCWSSDTYNPWPGVMENAPASRGYTGGFGADLMLKDLGLAVGAAAVGKQGLLEHGAAPHSGMLPCLRHGFSSFLSFSIARLRQIGRAHV